jgi:acetyl-CoA carboxylase biotin carboxylase subunit
VAVYSKADAGAPYLDLADEKICIGPGPAAESYLKRRRLIARPRSPTPTGIHPGYGFLSENPTSREICRDCKIEFIGPPAEAIRDWATRTTARKARARRRAASPWCPAQKAHHVERRDAVAHGRSATRC